MSKLLQGIGIACIVGWTAAGFYVWRMSSERIRVTLSTDSDAAGAASEASALALLDDRVARVEEDLRGLTSVLEANLRDLVTSIDRDSERSVRRIETGLGSLEARLDDLRSAAGAAAAERPTLAAETPVGILEEEPAPEPGIAEAAPKKSFLAFRLPSQEDLFHGRKRWTLLRGLCRVGFDAESTLHDFTGATAAVEGQFDADLSAPSDTTGHIRVEVGALRTGSEGRDDAMFEHLASEAHPYIEFELTGFEPGTVEEATERLTGRALGFLTVRGVRKQVAMECRMELDEARRLVVEGEMRLSLPDYDVPVPDKLGLISMKESVRVWIALRARGVPAAEVSPGGKS